MPAATRRSLPLPRVPSAWERVGVRALCAATLAAGLWLAHAAVAADINWAEAEQQATDLLRAYIQIDTSNPPGNEIAAARFLARRFRQAGIDTEVFESEPGRGSVLARVKGTGTLRPIVLLSHLDVVPAKAADGWDVPPFSGAVRDGYVYGRGAIDCKGPGTIEAMALLLLKRHGIRLKRDVIFLGTADEETGGRLGAGWMVAHHFDALRDAEIVVNEGASVRVLADGSRAYEVAVSEKTPCWLEVTATGPPGHGSAPALDTAVTRLVRALERLRLYQPPLRVTPEVQAYYAALAATQTGERQERYKDLRAALADDTFRRSFLEDPHDAALVHDTVTPTVLLGSPKTNVIPRQAKADLDCRLLPGDDPQAFVQTITDVIADPDVTVRVLLNFPASSSPLDTPFFAAVRTLAERDGAPVVPSVLTGFTDSHYFREKGIASYGFIPFDLSEDEGRREHGVNERVSTRNLRQGTGRLIEILQILDEEKPVDSR
jgi:acetylornithine deacetylase/succinyl-diaminopimelate desuccinylase-like protein